MVFGSQFEDHCSTISFVYYRSTERRSRSLFDVCGFEILWERARDVVEVWNPPGGRPDVDVIRSRSTLDVSRRRKRKNEKTKKSRNINGSNF